MKSVALGVLGLPSDVLADPGHQEFFRYEATLNDVIPKYPQVILCLYDLERWGAAVLMDTLRTHRQVIVDGMVHDNPYYIEPGRFVAGQG
jgi:MEDS: MEthanogen/methylotroph, DcmR Sensory domain